MSNFALDDVCVELETAILESVRDLDSDGLLDLGILLLSPEHPNVIKLGDMIKAIDGPR